MIETILALTIKTTADVKEFFRQLVVDEKLNFHPDDSFTEYVRDDVVIYSDEHARALNAQMDKAFKACHRDGSNIYALELDVMRDNAERPS